LIDLAGAFHNYWSKGNLDSKMRVINEEDIDLTVNILCRDKEGKRLEIYDLELELFKSNKELVLVISKLNFPDEPILWCGVKTLWMNSNNGKKCNSPKYSARLENLANRIKSFID